MSAPGVSVVLPVHDGGELVEQAIASVLAQTLPDFELVVFDDGSTDDTSARVLRIAATDPRVRLLRSARNLGLVGSSNRVVAAARAPLVARIDHDDLAHPQRLERQVAVFASRPDVVLVGALAQGIDAGGRVVRPRDRSSLLRPCVQAPFQHSSAMFRRDAFDRVGGYRPQFDGWEDADLFLRLRRLGAAVVLPEALTSSRYHATSTTLARSRADAAGDLARQTAWIAAFRRGGSWEEARPAADASTLARAVASLGVRHLWAGEPPAVTRDDLRHHRGAPPGVLLRLALLASWGRWHPASLRGVLAQAVRVRDAVASARIRDGQAVEWRCAAA